MNIPFNKPFLTGKETTYIEHAVKNGKISGNGVFTQKCHSFFEQQFQFKKVLLTTSCTDALEMAAILLDIQAGDEVIMPSYTFVSTANAFVLRGAKIIFADSSPQNPNIDITKIESLITNKTKAIVVVHYAGIACDMDVIMDIAGKYGLFVVEDAAQAIDSFYKGKALGSIGHLGTFSFHETKNIISGEGGMLVINDERFIQRAEIIWEKGTNRSAFWRGEIDKYDWVDIGSSFLPSEIIAAFLYAQLEQLAKIQAKRQVLWDKYYEQLKPLQELGLIKLPYIPSYATNNAHLFYIICRSVTERKKLISFLQSKNINAVFHYLALHKSPYYIDKHKSNKLNYTEIYASCLLRLPMYYDLEIEQVEQISKLITLFYKQ